MSPLTSFSFKAHSQLSPFLSLDIFRNSCLANHFHFLIYLQQSDFYAHSFPETALSEGVLCLCHLAIHSLTYCQNKKACLTTERRRQRAQRGLVGCTQKTVTGQFKLLRNVR